MKNNVGDKIEIKEFNEMIDDIIEAINEGKIKTNPLKKETVDLGNLSKEEISEETKIEETTLEKSEDKLTILTYNDILKQVKSIIKQQPNFIEKVFSNKALRPDKYGPLFVFKDEEFIGLAVNPTPAAKLAGCHSNTIRKNSYLLEDELELNQNLLPKIYVIKVKKELLTK